MIAGTGVALAFSFFAAQQDSAGIAGLAWLAGCWEMRSGARVTEEQWMTPRGGAMLGMSRTTRNDSLVEFEHVRMETRGPDLYYVASPSRQATAEFKATSLAAGTVTFENPAHDFPKKIFYTMHGEDSMAAAIEGPRGGTTRRITYPYRRVACPATEPSK